MEASKIDLLSEEGAARRGLGGTEMLISGDAKHGPDAMATIIHGLRRFETFCCFCCRSLAVSGTVTVKNNSKERPFSL